ncbi:MAG: transcriptional repressor LexA [Chloroflexia bacterium]
MRKMSERQRRILQYLEGFIREHGYPPSIRQIQTALGISSTSVVDYNLDLLEKRGLIRRQPRSSRSITLTAEPRPARRSVPLLGTIPAGQPLPASDDLPEQGEAAETLELPADLWPDSTEGLYALRVRGDSMIDAYITDGDVVILRRQDTARNGDMVAVWLRDRQEVTLKRFYQEGRRIRLQPENPNLAPIYVRASDVEIQGQVVGVIRRYR